MASDANRFGVCRTPSCLRISVDGLGKHAHRDMVLSRSACSRRRCRTAAPLHPQRLFGVVMGTVMVLVGCALWWTGRPPKRPLSVSTNALHVQPNNLGFAWHRADYWVDCWFDKDAKVDRCRLTDAKGAGLYEDVFLPCIGHTTIPQDLLVLDSQRTGSIWVQSQDKRINFPIVSLQDGQTLLPRSFYAEARRQAYCSE